MNKMKEEDRMIQKALKDFYNTIEIPDPRPSWKRVQASLQLRRKRKIWLKRIKIVTITLAVIGILILGIFPRT